MKVWKLKLLLFFVFFGAGQGSGWGQTHRNALAVSVGAGQLKEGFNYGLVFTGPMVGVEYRHSVDYDRMAAGYAADLRLTVPFSRGMVAYDVELKPLRAEAIFRVAGALRIGTAIEAAYRWQMYPELQNAHLFSEGEIGLKLVARYSTAVRCCRIDLEVENSLLGFVSHTERNEPYFYSLRADDFLIEPWRGLRFGSFGRYNHTSASLFFSSAEQAAKHRFGVGVDFFSIAGAGNFQSMNYHLKWLKTF
ncbi:MAG: hypothetical protein K2G93_07390 [Rikenella sp.]|nr:hypothetical protein [Rikenella sp.]